MNRKTKDSSTLAAGEKTYREQLPRLRRIEGQVRGLQQMIENERDCLDVTHQISATINALAACRWTCCKCTLPHWARWWWAEISRPANGEASRKRSPGTLGS